MATNITAITATGLSVGAKGPKQFQGLFDVIPFKVTLEDDTVAAQAAAQVDVTVPGAELGDFVMVAPAVDVTGTIVSAFVSAANTVTVSTFNVEGTDANTTLATPVVANGLVLKPKSNVYDSI
jgi:hypothetical protein